MGLLRRAAPRLLGLSCVIALATPGHAACMETVASFKRVVESDARSGNMNQSVYRRVKPEVDRAEAACAAGRDAESERMINSTKSRFGYR